MGRNTGVEGGKKLSHKKDEEANKVAENNTENECEEFQVDGAQF